MLLGLVVWLEFQINFYPQVPPSLGGLRMDELTYVVAPMERATHLCCFDGN